MIEVVSYGSNRLSYIQSAGRVFIRFTYPEGEDYTYVTEIITLGTGESSKYIGLSQEDIESLGNTKNMASMNYLVSESKVSQKIINEKILLDEISWTDDGFSKEIWSYDTDTLEDSNICRFPEHTEKYKKILTPESIKLLESVEWYYYYPEQFYDAAWGSHGEKGNVYVGSQFSPAVWGAGYVAEPAITYQYEPETGKIKILEFDMRKWWYR